MNDYIIASSKPWHKPEFSRFSEQQNGYWHWVDSPEQLAQKLENIVPRYIFFLHWNWKVPASIYENYECVCFHMTDVPYGRGGSPLQNLILAGHQTTKLTALKMVEELDAGPVYTKLDLTLDGTAEEIYIRAGQLCFDIIEHVIKLQPTPIEQQGEPTYFARRKPEQSELPKNTNLKELYNFIRMLDAPSYPLSFIQHGAVNLKFQQAKLENNTLTATVNFELIESDNAN